MGLPIDSPLLDAIFCSMRLLFDPWVFDQIARDRLEWSARNFARGRRYQSIKYVSQIQLCKLRVDLRAKDVSRDVDAQGSVVSGFCCAVPSGKSRSSPF